MDPKVILLGIGIGFLVAAFIGLILAFPIMWIWNYLMPALFSVGQIGYWQAFWLYFLCNLLIKPTVTNASNLPKNSS